MNYKQQILELLEGMRDDDSIQIQTTCENIIFLSRSVSITDDERNLAIDLIEAIDTYG